MRGFENCSQGILADKSDKMIMNAIAPGPVINGIEPGKSLPIEELRSKLGIIIRFAAQIGNACADLAHDWRDIMGKGNAIGERDIGDIAANSVDARIEIGRGCAERKTRPSRRLRLLAGVSRLAGLGR